MLELGPGPGLTTDLLRKRVPHLTAIEIDRQLAESLASRLNGGNVEVVKGDATEMPFANAQFSSSVCFTMLHHVHTPALQDQLLREVWRVLRPGGVFCRYRQPAEPIYAADPYRRHSRADRSRHFW